MKLASKADFIASSINTERAFNAGINPLLTWDDIRAICDNHTGSDLACSLLDRLTDMVERRVAT
jgi:hypothetical protein